MSDKKKDIFTSVLLVKTENVDSAKSYLSQFQRETGRAKDAPHSPSSESRT